MPACSEFCPIARGPEARSVSKDESEDGVAYSWLETDAQGVTVTAMENFKFPGVVTTEVPQDAAPTCKLPERIAQVQMGRAAHAAIERCAHVPGGKARIIVIKK